VEEADFYMSTLIAASNGPIRDLLELGSGAGNNASQYKRQHWIARSSTGSGTSSY
jgi:hypothetical protein